MPEDILNAHNTEKNTYNITVTVKLIHTDANTRSDLNVWNRGWMPRAMLWVILRKHCANWSDYNPVAKSVSIRGNLKAPNNGINKQFVYSIIAALIMQLAGQQSLAV